MGVLDAPGAPTLGTPLCSLQDLGDPGSKGFEFGEGAKRFALFLVRIGSHVFAYRNVCPHAGHPLDFPAGRFLTLDGKSIKCASHGALFKPRTGVCYDGPCPGRGLLPVPIHISGDTVIIGEEAP